MTDWTAAARQLEERADFRFFVVPAAPDQPDRAGGARGGVAIAGKFLFRIRRKHVFNPTNGGIVAMLLLTDQVWVSPGQWGSVAFFGFLMACLGGLVVNRASRSDVTYAFIAFYCALIFGRSLYLGEPMTIPLHRLQSGALLLFTFFMISDPKTTPDSKSRAGAVRRAGRVRRLVRAVPPVQDERAALVAGGLVDDGSPHRSAAARRPLLVEYNRSQGARK